MVLRTTRSSVTFGFPFRLEAFDELLPAGSYDIDTEEEGIEGNERTVYVRVATLLHVRTTGRVQTITVASKDLQRAIDADKIQSGLEAN